MPAIEARSEREVNDGLKLKIETAIEYRCILKTCAVLNSNQYLVLFNPLFGSRGFHALNRAAKLPQFLA